MTTSTSTLTAALISQMKKRKSDIATYKSHLSCVCL